MHLNGSGVNMGNFEFLKVGALIGDTVYFKTSKTGWYGANAGDDSNIGTGSGQQRIIIQRVPNYDNLTIDGTLTASAFDGNKYGILVFRVAGTLSGTGIISTNGLGYGSDSGYGAGSYSGNLQWATGGGGGYGTAGGGSVYGDQQLNKLFNGSGGGTGGKYSVREKVCGPNSDRWCTLWFPSGATGGRGGGAIYVAGNVINFQGTLTANGSNGNLVNGVYGGGGSGGSIRIEGAAVTLNVASAAGGTVAGSASGGYGRIAVYYYTSLASITDITPQPYTALLGQAPTATPPSTPVNLEYQYPWGSGSDGNLTDLTTAHNRKMVFNK